MTVPSGARLGSPPQVRGKLSTQNVIPLSNRITPAGAGKTVQRSCSAATARDHPRRCGENAYPDTARRTAPGSPPQVRGKHLDSVFRRGVRGITPAGAGKTKPSAPDIVLTEDHPRRCGENAIKLGKDVVTQGSPPQVRGKRCVAVQQLKITGITPAGAGKTRILQHEQ